MSFIDVREEVRKRNTFKVNKDIINLIQCYYRTRDSDDFTILGRSDEIVDRIAFKYGFKKPEWRLKK
ncbi:hypothetical protein LCGC14_1040870 [marine sediment metagenome]|uniref:Uncharacterized protein n=1 Tax=marine sediment metagenome TaxID=412755 RepID=A0A0F9MW58_9ZZZZ